MPQSLLLWRALTQWIGGLGIVLLFGLLLGSGSGGKRLLTVESVAIATESDSPRASAQARQVADYPAGLAIELSDRDGVIVATRDGSVTAVGGSTCCGYGYYVEIQHDNGYISRYTHLAAPTVQTGQRVTQGQTLGTGGVLGYSQGAQLHFEILREGVPVNPRIDVQISTVALTHGNLSIRVTETPVASQPPPFSPGQTVVLPRTQVSTSEQDGHIAIVGGASLQMLVDGLNQIGMKPSDIIAILQSIKASGALQAELVVQ